MLKSPSRYSAFLCVFILISALRMHAQSSGIKNLSIENGLSNNSVRCIYQDHNGFMWFGSYDGLTCYDGTRYRVFHNNPRDNNSLRHNYINAIGEDRHYKIFVGTGQGISIFNSLTQKITTGYYHPFGMKGANPIRFYINDLKTDSGGNVYIATNGGGLMVKWSGSDTAIQMNCPVFNSPWQNIQCFTIDRQQRVWCVVANLGLFQIDRVHKTLQLINDKIRSVRSMEADDQGNLWIAAFDGLYKYDVAANSLTNLFPQPPARHFSSNILCMRFDDRNTLWMGTEGCGIIVYDPASGKYTPFSSGSKGLTGAVIYSIFQDRENRKWIGTYKGGVDIIEPHESRFTTFRHDPANKTSLANNFVSAMCECKDGALWVGTDCGGISILSRPTTHFTNDERVLLPLRANLVPSMIQDKNGDVWIASYGGGVDRIDSKGGKRMHFTCYDDHTAKENAYVWQVFEDKEGVIWAATFADGLLYFFNRGTGRFQPFNYEARNFYCLAEDSNGTFWAGSSAGLTRIDKANRTYTLYPVPKPVRSIFRDSRQNLWVGTEGGGLLLFDETAGKIAKNYIEEDGLCNNAILTILEDDHGALWLSTFHGLSRMDPATRQFSNFYKEDGLPSNQFEFNSALKLRSGELAFGGINGFTIFRPDSLRSNPAMPPLLVTRLLVNNAPVAPNSGYVSGAVGDTITRLALPYRDGMLTVDFAALEYAAPDKITYAYYLEGWDKGWTTAHNIRTATYTRLEEGTYQLHVKATNTDGIWNPKEVLMEVVVLPPWYRSWIAYLLYGAVLAGVIYLLSRYRARQRRLQNEMQFLQLQREQEKKLALLERQKEKELNDKRLSLFTRISHEFRTPLTLIMNPLQDLLSRDATAKENGDLKSIYRNARRLHSLADQLLLFQKANTGDDPLMLGLMDYSQLCREVYLYFEQDAHLKKIEYVFACPEGLMICGDRQKLEMVLINLLSNAFKYTPAGGRIAFEVKDGEEVITIISDSGPGIPAAGGDKIFERFFQAPNQQNASKPGFGIGLFLARSFTELHQGKISYTSECGKGTVFTVVLPKSHPDAMPLEVEPVVGEVRGQGARAQEARGEDVRSEDPQEEEAPGEESLIGDDCTILVIEDNAEMRAYVAGIFTGEYRVLEAASAEEGLSVARESLPDLIITDINMQEMSGLAFCKLLKGDPAASHIPLVVLTADNTPESRLEAVELGADDYFNKPFDKDLLVAKVANLLKNKTALQNYFLNEVTHQKNDIKISAEHKLFLERCMAIVEQNIDDVNFTVHSLAAGIGMSHSKLYRRVKSVSGLTVNAFIRYIRMRKAAELFIHSDMNINEAAFEVGFSNVKYFQKQFFKLFGMNPSEYIRKYRKSFSKSYRLNKEAFGRK